MRSNRYATSLNGLGYPPVISTSKWDLVRRIVDNRLRVLRLHAEGVLYSRADREIVRQNLADILEQFDHKYGREDPRINELREIVATISGADEPRFERIYSSMDVPFPKVIYGSSSPRYRHW